MIAPDHPSLMGVHGSARCRTILSSVIIVLDVASSNTWTDVVNTADCGPVAGIRDESVVSFEGIKYAAATQRWSESQPLPGLQRCWDGTLQSKPPDMCVQMRVADPATYNATEDCLSLSVYTPVTSNAEPMPVMVFLHGGDLESGSVSHTGPDLKQAVALFSAESKPLIMVVAAYRLNIFGFLSVPELSNHGGPTGMYGIRDMQQALGWVQRNIGRFNGDAKKVTVFGQSSGGTGVFALVASPASKGLFSRAMSLSGSHMSAPDWNSRLTQTRS